MTPAVLHPRQPSLARANLLVLVSIGLAFWLSGFPDDRANPLLIIPSIMVLAGTADTARCIGRRWSLHHGAVLLCLYMDLMAATLVLFSFLYPYVFNLHHPR